MFSLACACMLVGCERPVLDEPSEGLCHLVLDFGLEPMPYPSRTAVALGDVVGRVNVAVFDASGQRVAVASQVSSDGSFGRVSLSLEAGAYIVVAVGHNGSGNATVSSAEKVTFPGNKVTDTFCWCGPLDVVGGIGSDVVPVVLSRCVSMVRLKLDGVPVGASRLRFYYLGGSSTLSPSAGLGCVESRQTEYRPVCDGGEYELYTMPHSVDDVLSKLTVTVLDDSDNELCGGELSGVPLRVGYVTNYSGDLFGGGGHAGLSISVDAEWQVLGNYNF